MKEINNILREMRDFADEQEKNNYYDLREMSTDSLRAYADRIESEVKAIIADRDNWRRQALDKDARANAIHKESLEVEKKAKMFRELMEIKLVCCHAGVTMGYDVACSIIKDKLGFLLAETKWEEQ